MRQCTERAPGWVARFRQDKSAAAAVEFALLLPFLIVLLFGGVDVVQGISAHRKVGRAAAVLSDLVAQSATITSAQVSNVFEAGSAALVPFDAAALRARITNVVVDGNGAARVDWSRGLNQAGHGRGTTYAAVAALPAQYRLPNTSFIVAEVTYGYTPLSTYAITRALDMSTTSYALPRSASIRTGVPCSDCS